MWHESNISRICALKQNMIHAVQTNSIIMGFLPVHHLLLPVVMKRCSSTCFHMFLNELEERDGGGGERAERDGSHWAVSKNVALHEKTVRGGGGQPAFSWECLLSPKIWKAALEEWADRTGPICGFLWFRPHRRRRRHFCLSEGFFFVFLLKYTKVLLCQGFGVCVTCSRVCVRVRVRVCVGVFCSFGAAASPGPNIPGRLHKFLFFLTQITWYSTHRLPYIQNHFPAVHTRLHTVDAFFNCRPSERQAEGSRGRQR